MKRIVAALASDAEALAAGRDAVLRAFGPMDLESHAIPFDFTDYYRDEMGVSILRQLWAFETLADPAGLAEWKLLTQRIEGDLAARLPGRPPRPVNLDPGYLTLNKLVLASTKDREQRVYLGQGIFAEITLCRQRGKWQPFPHTFPDYAAGTYTEFLERARRRYKEQLGRATV